MSILSLKRSDFTGNDEQWKALAATASFTFSLAGQDVISGDSIEIENAVGLAADKKPYGDVHYADPGYKDGVKRYPIDTEEHIRAAWSYINQEKNHKGYTSDQVAKIKARIVSAWKKRIDPKGPPSAQ